MLAESKHACPTICQGKERVRETQCPAQQRRVFKKQRASIPAGPPTQSNRYCGVLFFIGLFSAFTIFTEATSIWPVLASAVPIICT